MLSGKTFLITGATGRLGHDTVMRLETLGATVLPLVLHGYPHKPKRVEWLAKSKPIIVLRAEDLNGLDVPDYVVNFHWRIDRCLQWTDHMIYQLNCNINRLNFLWEWLSKRPPQRFINISSIKIFSHLNQNPISSGTEPRPASPYGLIKVTAEKFFDMYFYNFAIPVVHLRLCSIASVGEHPSHLMTQLFKSTFENRRILLNTRHVSHILYIDEAVDLIINASLIADRPKYIIAPSSQLNDYIVDRFEEVSKQKLKAAYVDFTPGIEDPTFISDIEMLHTDWTRTMDIDSMIKAFIDLNRQPPNNLLTHIQMP